MTYDLVIRNGRVIDGTGSAAFNADVGIGNGKIVDIGKLTGSAKRSIDAQGQVVAPGFIDSHTHFDAQVTWDPLCTWSCYHGVTTVVTGNCSLGIAPVRPGKAERLAEFLSYVEALPMETLKTVNTTWQTFGEYLDTIDKRLGVNVAALVGHTPIRYYVMGDDCQSRDPTPEEIDKMKAHVREAIESGAIGLSFSLSKGQVDPQGVRIPSLWAKEDELFALSGVLGELGTGVLQVPAGAAAEEKTQLLSRISEQTGRPFIFSVNRTMRKPDAWKAQMGRVQESLKKGIRTYPTCSPVTMSSDFNMHNCQIFRAVPSWQQVLLSNDDDLKMKMYADPEFRKKLHYEVVEWPDFMEQVTLGKNWPDTVWIKQCRLEKNKKYEGITVRKLAEMTGKGIIDAFLDLVVEENLDTEFLQFRRGFDPESMNVVLQYPFTIVGNSDAGAHVQFRADYGYSSVLLGEWVRKHKLISLETAVRKLSFDVAHFFGIYDRGLLQPGMAADIVVFDPSTIGVGPKEKITDLPAGAWRLKAVAEGIMCTIVNGEVLIENGEPTGALPGQVVRNSLYRQRQPARA